MPPWVIGVYAVLFGLQVAGVVSQSIRDRAGRPRTKPPAGRLRTVRGIARGPHAPSPFEHVPCLFAWVRLVSENTPYHRATREVAVGRDFALESSEGRFTVRFEGLDLRGAPRFSPVQPVEATPDGVVAQVIESVHMDKPYWAEIHVRDGDELEVTGVCRMEPLLEGREGGPGFRDTLLGPTLSGAGGRLDVRFIR